MNWSVGLITCYNLYFISLASYFRFFLYACCTCRGALHRPNYKSLEGAIENLICGQHLKDFRKLFKVVLSFISRESWFPIRPRYIQPPCETTRDENKACRMKARVSCSLVLSSKLGRKFRSPSCLGVTRNQY